ncbi:MAG: hypothetical protein ACKN9T_08350 [Candidatus Methylumidiphilus sp.]
MSAIKNLILLSLIALTLTACLGSDDPGPSRPKWDSQAPSKLFN